MTEPDEQPDDANRNVRPGLRSHIFMVCMQVLIMCMPLTMWWKVYGRRGEEGARVATAVGMLLTLVILAVLVFHAATREWRWRWGISWPIRGRGIAQPQDGYAGGEEILLVSLFAAIVISWGQHIIFGLVVWVYSGTFPADSSWIGLLIWLGIVTVMGHAIVKTLRQLPKRGSYGETFE